MEGSVSELAKGEEEVRMVLANRFGLGMMLWDGIGGVDRRLECNLVSSFIVRSMGCSLAQYYSDRPVFSLASSLAHSLSGRIAFVSLTASKKGKRGTWSSQETDGRRSVLLVLSKATGNVLRSFRHRPGSTVGPSKVSNWVGR